MPAAGAQANEHFAKAQQLVSEFEVSFLVSFKPICSRLIRLHIKTKIFSLATVCSRV